MSDDPRPASAAAERSSTRRLDVYTALAHDLRNRLGPMRAAVEMLDEEALGRERRRRVHQTLRSSLDHLARLVDELIESALAGSAEPPARRRRLDLCALLGEVVDGHRLGPGGEHGVHLASPEAPVWMDGDPVLLRWVFDNLLDNAVKFNGDGGAIRVVVDAAVDGEVGVSVRDGGRGLAADELAAVWQVDTAGDRRPSGDGGLGLGLGIVRQLVELHGGRVEAASDGPGRGSAFRVVLPAATPD